jgi:hypothetical protein
LNFDDPLVRDMQRLTKAKIFFYGLTPEAELWADGVEGLGLDGVKFRLHYHGETMHVHIPMIGRHSVETALRATAVALVEGLSWQEVLTGLSHGHTQLRLVAVRSKTGALLLDDTYNASPESMLAALNLLEEVDEAHHVADLQGTPVLFGGLNQRHALVEPMSDWLFEQHVISGFKRRQRRTRVILVRGGDDRRAGHPGPGEEITPVRKSTFRWYGVVEGSAFPACDVGLGDSGDSHPVRILQNPSAVHLRPALTRANQDGINRSGHWLPLRVKRCRSASRSVSRMVRMTRILVSVGLRS